MPAVIHVEERAVIDTPQYLPAVSIVLPFKPMMSSKSELESKLKRAVKKVELQLMDNYTVDKALPVLLKLNFLIQNINYNTHKKSIAIFISPVTEKVYYLDIDVDERIVIDESFKIRDLIHSKKQNLDYLILMLSAEKSKMYVANDSKFTLIKSNVPVDINSETLDEEHNKEKLLDKFLHSMDDDLQLIITAYKLPVFVVATEQVISHFKKITKNAEKIVGFIQMENMEATELEMYQILQRYIQDWKKVKQQALLQEIGMAVDYEKVAFGIEDVWESAMHTHSKLLVIEKDFICTASISAIADTISRVNINAGNPFYIKDAVDNVIEKVLQNGGDVEFIENDMLKDYGRIALIREY